MNIPDNCLEAAIYYVEEMNWSVIPLKPNSKIAAIPWTEFQTRKPTVEEIEKWFKQWPDANLAVLTGAPSGFVAVDVDSNEGAEWVKKNFGITGLYNITKKGWHGCYSSNGEEVKNHVGLAPGVDIRGDGGYIVAPPSVIAGHKYYWDIPPGLNGWEDVIPFKMEITKKSHGNLSHIDFSKVEARDEDSMPLNKEEIVKGERNNTLTSIVGSFFNKGLDKEDVLALALDRNKRIIKPPLSTREVRQIVNSIAKREATRLIVEPKIELVESYESDEEFPIEDLLPGGLLQWIMEEIQRCSVASHPIYELGAAIAFLGSLIGYKVRTESGLLTTFYNVSVGYSSAGKNAAVGLFSELLPPASDARDILGMTAFTSATALLRHLEAKRRQISLAVIDEVDRYLKLAKDRPTGPLGDIPKDMSTLWNSKPDHFDKPYADRDYNIYIPWKHFSMYGTATPTEFWDCLSATQTDNGFVARLLVFESLHDIPEPKDHAGAVNPWLQEILEKLYLMAPERYEERTIPLPEKARLKEKKKGEEGKKGNIAAALRAKFDVPIPHIIKCDNEALALRQEFKKKINKIQNQDKEGRGNSVWGKATEQSWKLALVHTISKWDPDTDTAVIPSMEIESDSMEWGIRVAEEVLSRMAANIRDTVAENAHHQVRNRIMRMIRQKRKNELKAVKKGSRKPEYAKKGLSLSELTDKIPEPPKVISDALRSLISAGRIVLVTYKPPRGPSCEIYCEVKR